MNAAVAGTSGNADADEGSIGRGDDGGREASDVEGGAAGGGLVGVAGGSGGMGGAGGSLDGGVGETVRDGGGPGSGFDGSAGTGAASDGPQLAILGSACGADTACLSGHCVEGVCCNQACITSCYSCRHSTTDDLDGLCAPVKAGIKHLADCAIMATNSCGTDGKCDGNGACEKWATGTVCGAVSCPAGTSSQISVPICDGNGHCVQNGSTACGFFTCNSGAASCYTACSTSQQCTSTAYCDGAVCRENKTPSELCVADAECQSLHCGGRCCPTGVSCSCPQPTAANILKNPGFDSGTSLDPWTLDVGSDFGEWRKADATSCPYSGSIWLTGMASFAQCVSVHAPGAYKFGFSIENVNATSSCVLEGYSSGDCSGLPTTLHSYDWLNGVWSSLPDDVTIPVGTTSVRVTCRTSPAVSGGGAYFDMGTLSPSPAGY